MTNYNATIDVPGRAGSVGQHLVASGYYDLAGAITGHASTGDTITFANILPKGGCKVISVQVVSPELDTDASPSGICIVGTSADDNGFVTTTNVGLPAQAPANGLPLNIQGNGELIGTAVYERDIIIEFTDALATSATTGRVRVYAVLEGLAG